MTPRPHVGRTAPGLAILLALGGTAGCAGTAPGPSSRPVAIARADDDHALTDAGERLGPLQGHFVAVARGRVLGGTMLPEDTARELHAVAGPLAHAYFFMAGEEGERRATIPGIYGPRVAGNGLLAALGLQAIADPGAGTLTLGRGSAVRTFPYRDGAAIAEFHVAPASGLGSGTAVAFVIASGFEGTALVTSEDAAVAGLVLSEVPGTATIAEILTGRTLTCRRALARVTLEGVGDLPGGEAAAVVEVWFPE